MSTVSHAEYLREMARMAMAATGHTPEGRKHIDNLYCIAASIEAMEREIALMNQLAEVMTPNIEKAKAELAKAKT